MALVDKKLTELTEILSVPDNAFIHVVDPNDVSQSPQGSSYKAKKSTIGGAVKAQVTVSGTVKTNINNADPIVYLKGSVDALLSEKQDTLVNGINIASINSQNLLNGGNIEIETNTNLKVVNEPNLNRTALLTDANSIILFTQLNPKTYTIPTNATIQFAIGTKIEVVNNNNSDFSGNAVTILGGSGVTFISNNGLVLIRNTKIILIKIAENTWKTDLIFRGVKSTAAGEYSVEFANVTGSNIYCQTLLSTLGISGVSDYLKFSVGSAENHWEANRNIRYTGNIPLTLPNELTPKSYVDAIPNPTTNVLPKKGANGFVDSAISESSLGTQTRIDQSSFTEVSVRNDSAGGFAKFSLVSVSERGKMQYNINNPNIFFTTVGAIPFFIGTDDLIRLTVSDIGNIGIRTTTPTEALDVNGSIKLSNLLKLGQFTTATEPAYVKGASFFNTTLNKMRVGGATAYETVTSS
jgi:hypothetical protein